MLLKNNDYEIAHARNNEFVANGSKVGHMFILNNVEQKCLITF